MGCGGSPIPKSIKKTCIACGISALGWLLATGRAFVFFGHGIGIAIARASARVGRAIVPLYRAWWMLRRYSVRMQALGQERIVRILTSRTLTYGVFTIAVLGLAAQSIHARERGGFVASRPILAAFTVDHEEVGGEETVLGPAIPSARWTFRAASVSRLAEPVVLGAEAAAPAPVASAAFVQPVITDAAVADTERAGIRSYTVEEGDTLSTIAEKFGITTSTLLWENRLSVWSLIRPGDTLRILPVDGVTHTVQRGNTLEQIAKRYGTDAEEILEFNHLVDADDLEVGDLLIVPGGRPVPTAPPIVRRAPARPTLALPSIPGKLLWPSAAGYRISQYFTWRHHGIDVAVAYGTPAFASDDGTVVSSGWIRGYGYQVTIDHGNGLRTRYAHNSRNLVASGQAVTRGQTIALVGSTGRSTGPHIHYEVFANGVRVNPFTFLR